MKGWINPSKPSQLLVQYSQRDVITKQKYKFLRTFQEREDHFTYQAAPFGFSMSNVIGFEPSPTWKYLCVIRSIKKESDKDEKYAIEVSKESMWSVIELILFYRFGIMAI